MRRWLLTLCLWTYPLAVRERDGAYLLDLSLELGAESGWLRQALSLVRGGVGERARLRSRLALRVVGVAVALVVGAGGVALAAPGNVRVEVRSCAQWDCSAAQAWAHTLERRGWSCERSASSEASWQCVEP